MRAADWKRLARPSLASTHVAWKWHGSLAYIDPSEWVVHGLLAEDSAGRPDEFYLWVVQMPLMVPADGVVDLSLSSRYGGGTKSYSRYDVKASEAINAAALLAIANHRSGRVVPDPPGGVDNVRMQEARGYGLLLAGDHKSSLEVLRRVGRYNARQRWEQEVLDRARSIESLVESGAAEDAYALLRRWRDGNCTALGL